MLMVLFVFLNDGQCSLAFSQLRTLLEQKLRYSSLEEVETILKRDRGGQAWRETSGALDGHVKK